MMQHLRVESKKSLYFQIFSFYILLWPCSLAITSTGRVGLWFCGSYVQEHPKAQPAVVMVLKRLRRQGHGFKYFRIY